MICVINYKIEDADGEDAAIYDNLHHTLEALNARSLETNPEFSATMRSRSPWVVRIKQKRNASRILLETIRISIEPRYLNRICLLISIEPVSYRVNLSPFDELTELDVTRALAEAKAQLTLGLGQ